MKRMFRNSRKTNWELFGRLIDLGMNPVAYSKIDSVSELKAITDTFTSVMLEAFGKAYPKRVN